MYRTWEDKCRKSRRRQADYIKMEEVMTAKMKEGFRNEQQARQQAQKKTMAGLENEGNARQMVQIDLQAIKDKIRQLESGSNSGGTVGSEVSTAVGKRAKRYFRKTTAGSGRSTQRLLCAATNGVEGLGHGPQAVQVPRTHRHRGVESHQ